MSALAEAYPMANPRSFETILLQISLPPEAARQFRNVILPFELMDHQIRALHCALAWPRFGLYHEARTGKTIVMQLVAIFYARYGFKTLFLMPPVLFVQFLSELNKIEGHGLQAEVLNGSASTKQNKLADWALGTKRAPDILITTTAIFAGPFGKRRKQVAILNNEYLSRVYTCLTWDECHIGLQDEDSKIFASVEKFIKNVANSRLILATGTPITSELKSAYSHIRLKTPDIYHSRRHFDAVHVDYQTINVKGPPTARNPDGIRRIPTIRGYLNQEALSNNLYQFADRARKLEVLGLDVPNLQIVPIKLAMDHLKFYKQAIKDKLVEIEGEMLDLRQEQALRQFALRIITAPEFGGKQIKDNAVIAGIQALLDTTNLRDNKAIVFANFNNSIEYLAKRFENYRPAVIYGQNDGGYNAKEVVRFKTHKDCNLAIINPQAGGVGLTLGDVCQVAIFAEPVSSPGLFDQAASRILLKNQTAPVTVYLLKILDTASPKAIERMLERTIDVRDVMKDKQTLVDELLPKT